MIKVLIDNGHGSNTPGKHSPDMRLKEYKWCREVAKMVVDGLKGLGFDAQLLVPETYDVQLNTRAIRANRWCVERGAKNVLLVSIHNNAAGSDNQWHTANYWSVWVYRQEIRKAGKLVQVKEASFESKKLATLFTKEARALGWNVSVGAHGDFKDANFAILRDTLCPAILTENFFQDNKANVDYLLSDKGKKEIADFHINTIKKYLNGE